MPKLGVNIDHIATIRQARLSIQPDPVAAAVIVELAGADGITVHLREDRRHIQDRDVFLLKETIKTRLNLEMAAVDEMVKIASKLKPESVCLVPEKRKELTTEGGLDVCVNKKHLRKVVSFLQKKGIMVSLFIDPDLKQIKAASEIKAQCVELHTGAYAEAKKEYTQKKELKRLQQAGDLVVKSGLRLNAGHGLDYKNVVPVAGMEGIEDLNIGHSIIARAVLVGLYQAVKEMKSLIGRNR
ncbi:pyridoxine 5'-phosphate synthase [bacterium]|nr:pyridoxine 5'-phosphate synthase [bacterium]